LLSGKLKEPDVEPGSAFPGTGFGVCGGCDGEEEVGLHVYHIERFDAGGAGPEKKRFCEFALGEVMRRAKARTGWKVVGMSGAFDAAGEDNGETMLTLSGSPYRHAGREKSVRETRFHPDRLQGVVCCKGLTADITR
jgi:hypothetical protein